MEIVKKEGENTYVIETLDNTSNEVNFSSTPIVICTENEIASEYILYNNGEIIFQQIEDEKSEPKRLNEDLTSEISEKQTTKEIKSLTLRNPKKRRKILSYDKEFKPSIGFTSNSSKGFIRYGRKHLIIDQHIMISPREFKSQLIHTEDLVAKTELAASTKQQMRHMLTGITRLFAHAAHKIPNSDLLHLYVRNCTSKEQPNDEAFIDMELQPLSYQKQVDLSTIKRITRKRKQPEEIEIVKHEIETPNKTDNTTNIDHVYSKIEYVEVKPESDELQILIMQDNSSNVDHEYSKTLVEREEGEIVSVKDEYCEESEIVISLDEVNQISDCETNVEDGQIMFVEDSTGNSCELGQNNIELLLAAASESNDVMAICNNANLSDGNRIIILHRDDEMTEILGSI